MSKLNKIFSLSFYEYRVLIKSWLLYIKWDFRISRTHYINWQSHILQHTESSTTSKLSTSGLSTKNSPPKPEHKTEPENKTELEPENKNNQNQVQTLIKLNEIAGRNHYKHMNCLRRCLCQKELLNDVNITTKLHLGVKFVEGKLAAHSWLSSNHIIINDSDEVISTYQELKTIDDSQTLALFK